MVFIRDNKIFSCLYLLAVVMTIAIVHSLGFREAVGQIASQPERLRDITFPIWERHSFLEHGFLVFLSKEDFENKIAYSNHSTLYLFYMYILFKLEMIAPALQMRITAAFLNILILAGITFFFISRLVKVPVQFGQGFLIILSVVLMVSMPGFWISSARFNVDNSFPLVFSFQALLAYLIWRHCERRKAVFSGIVVFAIFAPISAALLGAALFFWACRSDGLEKRLGDFVWVAFVAAVSFYLLSPILSKTLGFTSSNSGWLFRAGLDGDISYFTNVLKSIVDPYFPRPVHTLAVPAFLLFAQFAFFFVREGVGFSAAANQIDGSEIDSAGIFYYLLFLQYTMTALFWPQAVSIHPYLYDHLLMAPVFILIILNFACRPVQNFLSLWLILLLFCISFHFQQIAQSKCQGCYYPSAWSTETR